MRFEYPEGATPLDPDEAEGLIPKNILLQSELNECEQANIVQGEIWLSTQRVTVQQLFSQEFIKKTHNKMFNETWSWAGKFRQTDKNIGCCWSQVAIEIKKLGDDVVYWVMHDTFSKEEIAIRFHHRLVAIHPFANGNGRLSRILTDRLLTLLGHKKFSWGSVELLNPSTMRKNYIYALKEADKGNYDALWQFAKT